MSEEEFPDLVVSEEMAKRPYEGSFNYAASRFAHVFEPSQALENLAGAWARRQDTLYAEYGHIVRAPAFFKPERMAVILSAGERSDAFMRYWNDMRTLEDAVINR